jgi:S1-C subfamily serine protease
VTVYDYQVGDEIVSVDGVDVFDVEAVTSAVRGSDDIGTICVVSLLRGKKERFGMYYDVPYRQT